jgi:predicted MFS family arabinose efflux permease
VPLASAPSLTRLVEVVRKNPDYRRLFLANLISQLGDWFNVVALFSLLLELTGRGESVAYVLVCHLVPMFVAGPVAGVVADRYSRRAILVAADFARGAVVLGFLFIRTPSLAPLAYVLVALQSTLSAFAEPAQQATFPNLVAPEDLVVASALENSLWSTTLAVGSALGGLLMLQLGRGMVFGLDAASYVISGLMLRGLPARVAGRQPRNEAPADAGLLHALGLTDFLDGVGYLSGHPRIRALILVKGGFGLTLGGVLVLLAFFGERVFGGSHGSGIAMLWTARGVGSFLGPFVAWRLGGDSPSALRRGITGAFAMVCISYLVFSRVPTLLLAAPILAVANAGGSILWTYGSSLQALLVPDAYRGRVAAADMGCMTLTMAGSTLLVGHLLDAGYPPRTLMCACGLVALLPIAFWLAAQRHFRAAE